MKRESKARREKGFGQRTQTVLLVLAGLRASEANPNRMAERCKKFKYCGFKCLS